MTLAFIRQHSKLLTVFHFDYVCDADVVADSLVDHPFLILWQSRTPSWALLDFRGETEQSYWTSWMLQGQASKLQVWNYNRPNHSLWFTGVDTRAKNYLRSLTGDSWLLEEYVELLQIKFWVFSRSLKSCQAWKSEFKSHDDQTHPTQPMFYVQRTMLRMATKCDFLDILIEIFDVETIC